MYNKESHLNLELRLRSVNTSSGIVHVNFGHFALNRLRHNKWGTVAVKLISKKINPEKRKVRLRKTAMTR